MEPKSLVDKELDGESDEELKGKLRALKRKYRLKKFGLRYALYALKLSAAYGILSLNIWIAGISIALVLFLNYKLKREYWKEFMEILLDVDDDDEA